MYFNLIQNQGNVDISALRDRIKQLELELEDKNNQLDEIKCRGHLPAGRSLHSYRYNPTFSRQKRSEVEMEKLKRENIELKRLQGELKHKTNNNFNELLKKAESNNAGVTNQVELDELKQQLSDETKTREKLLQVTR